MLDGAGVLKMHLPAPEQEVVAGISWGRHDALFTPAYWSVQCRLHQRMIGASTPRLRQGRSLTEEIAACLLGGYRIRAELSTAAFVAVRDAGLLETGSISAARIERELKRPLLIYGRSLRYPFPRMKARQLADSLNQLPLRDLPTNADSRFRDKLTELPGVGLKTASWITRNWLDSEEVAVLDIHIARAGKLLGLFDQKSDASRNYRAMEGKFLSFARALRVPVSLLDLVMWSQMRRTTTLVKSLLAGKPSQA